MTAKVSFVDISPSKHQRRKTCSLKKDVDRPVDVLQPPDYSDHTDDYDGVGPSAPINSEYGVSNDTRTYSEIKYYSYSLQQYRNPMYMQRNRV